MHPVLVVLSAAKQKFGDPRQWHQREVTDWVIATMKALQRGEPLPQTDQKPYPASWDAFDAD